MVASGIRKRSVLPQQGDQIKLKGLDWYIKEGAGCVKNVLGNEIIFLPEMSSILGSTVTFDEITEEGNVCINESNYIFPMQAFEFFDEVGEQRILNGIKQLHSKNPDRFRGPKLI